MANDFFLSRLEARRQPYVFSDGRVYLITPGQAVVPQERIDIGGSTHHLVPGPTITELVEDCLKHRDMPQPKGKDDVVHIALYDIAGRLINVLGDKKLDKDRALEKDYMQAFYAKNYHIHDGKTAAATSLVKDCVRELPSTHFVYWDGEYHQLRASRSEGAVRFGGRAYDMLAPYNPTNPVQGIVERIDDEFYDSQEEQGSSSSNMPEEIEFEHFKISFEDNHPRIILKIKPYVLRDYLDEQDIEDEEDYDDDEDDKPKRKKAKPKLRYCAMSALELSVELGSARQAPVVMVESGQSPFGYTEDELCMGHYSDSYFASLSYPDAIVRLLLDARKVVLTGYQPNCNPRDKAYDCGTEITKKQARHRGLKVTNELGLEPRRR